MDRVVRRGLRQRELLVLARPSDSGRRAPGWATARAPVRARRRPSPTRRSRRPRRGPRRRTSAARRPPHDDGGLVAVSQLDLFTRGVRRHVRAPDLRFLQHWVCAWPSDGPTPIQSSGIGESAPMSVVGELHIGQAAHVEPMPTTAADQPAAGQRRSRRSAARARGSPRRAGSRPSAQRCRMPRTDRGRRSRRPRTPRASRPAAAFPSRCRSVVPSVGIGVPPLSESFGPDAARLVPGGERAGRRPSPRTRSDRRCSVVGRAVGGHVVVGETCGVDSADRLRPAGRRLAGVGVADLDAVGRSRGEQVVGIERRCRSPHRVEQPERRGAAGRRRAQRNIDISGTSPIRRRSAAPARPARAARRTTHRAVRGSRAARRRRPRGRGTATPRRPGRSRR